MSTMEHRMSSVERTLQDIAAINREIKEQHREMQEQHRAWQEQDRVRREEERVQLEARREEERAQLEARREEERAQWEARQERERVQWETRQEKERVRWEAQREEERLQREADRRAYEEESRKAQRKWGEMANKMGTLVEDVVAPGIPTVFQAVFGRARIEAAIQRMRRTHATDPGREREFDYVVVAGDLVLITQTKSTLRPEDIPDTLNMLREAREYLPEYTDKRIVGAVASFSVHPSLIVAGERAGLLMFGLGTGLLQVLNTPGFQPARF